jgi:hypothetical protein
VAGPPPRHHWRDPGQAGSPDLAEQVRPVLDFPLSEQSVKFRQNAGDARKGV